MTFSSLCTVFRKFSSGIKFILGLQGYDTVILERFLFNFARLIQKLSVLLTRIRSKGVRKLKLMGTRNGRGKQEEESGRHEVNLFKSTPSNRESGHNSR